jgi:predicted helicase
MFKSNIGLLACRQIISETYRHAFITDIITDYCSVSNLTKERTYLFPLYLYNQVETNKKKSSLQTMILFEPEMEYDKYGRTPNISFKVFRILEKIYSQRPSPEQILYYCYAILYSNLYRKKYSEFLKIDFPRIPFTPDYQLFLQIAVQGEELTRLHLLRSKILNNPTVKYHGKGEDIIVKPIFDEEKQCVFINSDKYFLGINKEIWEYYIGGYQIAKKFLDWRIGRKVDVRIYCQLITAISKTIELQKEIDVLFVKVETNAKF